MAKRTCIFFISFFLLLSSRAASQDTVMVPLHVRAGYDLSGTAMKFLNNNLISYGALASVDLNQSFAVSAGLRYTSFSSLKYNYDYNSRGTSFVIGADYNFMKPKAARGRYYAGIGLRYGLSFFDQEATGIKYTNPWGEGESFFPLSHHLGHFIEITPGVRTELFPGVTIGWNLYMRLLITSGAGRDLKPVWMPGYGDATSGMTTGAEYYISFSIPYKKIRVIVKPKPVTEEEEGAEGEEIPPTNSSSFSGGRL